ncbi:MAG: glutamate--cysteine ligase [Coxiella sp. (in: Bacteria)]|nr:MAG: glutamate--cysteine ligase [Coxiella sp. (in: g-proteobacteria)]
MPTIQVPHLETALKGPLKALEKQLLDNKLAIEGWFREQWQKTPPPFYGSTDLRNAGFKIAPVDTNLFPAGFNNLNEEFSPLCMHAIQATLQEVCPEVKRLLLIPESHTRNQFYFESLAKLQEYIMGAGYDVRIGSLNPEITEPKEFELPSGRTVILEPLIREGDKVGVSGFFPCCIILNNDLSDGLPKLMQGISQRVMPPVELGWTNRLKSEHFAYYAKVADEFAELIGMDPWLLQPYFDQCPDVDFMKQEGQKCLVLRAEMLFKRIQKKYAEYGIKHDPFLVVKADQGTYGMAVMMIKSPEELLTLNRKQRTRMSTLKGGVQVTRAIIQEGVYSFETVDGGAVAEPVVYMMGRHVVGGFYRVHAGRGSDENLNAPGMNFKPLAFSSACHSPYKSEGENVNRFYAYGVVGRLALLAAARELTKFCSA